MSQTDVKPFSSGILPFLLSALCALLLLSARGKGEPVRYTQAQTIPFHWDSLEVEEILLDDSLEHPLLYRFQDARGRPLAYGQRILTSVCFDDKCRPLDVYIYWNITGRYLGFELPDGEYLSRQDHDPFIAADYERLNTLLADGQLPFAEVSFEALIRQFQPDPDVEGEVDAVSGATSQEIKAYVVEGAAYTTYTMWRIVYGPVRDSIMKRTEAQLQPELLSQIFESSATADQLWALERLKLLSRLGPELENQVLAMIADPDYNLAYAAIRSLGPAHLRSTGLQDGLLAAYSKAGYSLKKPILQKLLEAASVSPEVIRKSWTLLPEASGEQLRLLLDLYRQHARQDLATARAVAQLLKAGNAYISEKAYQYLNELDEVDKQVRQLMQDYQQSRQ